MFGAIFISDDLVLSILLFAISHLQGVPKNVLSIDVFDNLGPLWTYLDTFGPFQTKINLLPHKGFGGGAFEQKIIFLLKWSKRANTGLPFLFVLLMRFFGTPCRDNKNVSRLVGRRVRSTKENLNLIIWRKNNIFFCAEDEELRKKKEENIRKRKIFFRTKRRTEKGKEENIWKRKEKLWRGRKRRKIIE